MSPASLCLYRYNSRYLPWWNTVDFYSQWSLSYASQGSQLQAGMWSAWLSRRLVFSMLCHVCASGGQQPAGTSSREPTKHISSPLLLTTSPWKPEVVIPWKSANVTNLGVFFFPLQSWLLNIYQYTTFRALVCHPICEFSFKQITKWIWFWDFSRWV